MYIDRIDLTLPEANIASILAAYTGAEALLEPLTSVSKADRKRYAKLGLKNEALALQIIEVGRANPNLIPRRIDFEMIERVEDAMLLLGVDVYATALSMYHCLRSNADTTSLKETMDELRKGFARPNQKKKAEAEDAPVVETPATPPAPSRAALTQETPSQPEPLRTAPPAASTRPRKAPQPTAPIALPPCYSLQPHPSAPAISFFFPLHQQWEAWDGWDR